MGSGRRKRHVWLALAAGFLLGCSAVAFAGRLDVLPLWLTGMVAPRTSPAAHAPSSPRGSKARSATVVSQPSMPSKIPEADERPAAKEETRPARKGWAASPAASAHALGSKSPSDPGPLIRRGAPRFLYKPNSPQTGTEPVHAPADRNVQLALVGEPRSEALSATPKPDPVAPSSPSPRRAGGAQYLVEAVRTLRENGQPRKALRLLESHADDLGRSGFAEETLRLRVEAHVKLHEDGEALRLLDGMALGDADKFRDLLLERGRLRAEAGRCAEGVRDLSLVLDRTTRPPKEALLKRAYCRKALGDAVGATVDLDRYQREFGVRAE